MTILPAAVAVVAAEEAAAQGDAVAGGVLSLLNDAPQVGHGNIVVHGFTIEGVDDVTPEVRQHVVKFYNQIVPLMTRASQSYWPYPKVKFELLRTALMRHRDVETLISLKKYILRYTSGTRHMPLLSMKAVLCLWNVQQMVSLRQLTSLLSSR
jgi:hypothetical protein